MSKSHVVAAVPVRSLALGIRCLTSPGVASRAYLQRGKQQEKVTRTLDVTGSARQALASNLAPRSIRVAGEGKTLEDAFQKTSQSGEKVREFPPMKGFPAEAARNARQRADRIARESGCKVGPVKDVRAGVLPITKPRSTETTSVRANDTSTVEQDVTSGVPLSRVIER